MLNTVEICNNYVAIAKGKTEKKWYGLIVPAVLAGVFISFGAALSTVAGAASGGSALVKGAVFPIGLILVVVCGAELFTGNCLLVSPAVYGHIKWRGLLKNWGIVYLGNLLGSVLIAVLVVYSHSMNDAAALACVSAAAVKSELDFFDCFLRGILCNMLVCLAVWAAMASKSTGGKILAVYLPVLAFVVCGFEHSVANMYYITSGLLTAAEYGIESSLTLGNALLFCLLPSTLGNIIGGSMISLLYGYIGFGKVRRNEHDGVAKNENVNTVASEAPQSRTNQMFDKPNV